MASHHCRFLFLLLFIALCIGIDMDSMGYHQVNHIYPGEDIVTIQDSGILKKQADNPLNWTDTLYPFCRLDSKTRQAIQTMPSIVHFESPGFLGWSVICKDMESYKFYIGSTSPNSSITYPDFDTITLIADNIRIIEWSFDSLVNRSRTLHQVTPTRSGSLLDHMSLYVVENDSIQFEYRGDRFLFSGPEHQEFEERIVRLSYLMLWLYYGEVRHYLPTPNERN